MPRQLQDAELWVFEGADEATLLREIAEWLEEISIGLRNTLTIFSITFEDIGKEDQEEEGPLEGAKVIAYVSLEGG